MLQLMFVFFFVWQVPETPFGIILFSASSSKKTVKILDSVFKIRNSYLACLLLLDEGEGKKCISSVQLLSRVQLFATP